MGPWLRLADARWWYTEHPMWRPVCWELALGPAGWTREEELTRLATGAAPEEKSLWSALESGAHPTSPAVREGLARGQTLYYRSVARPTLAEAEELARQRQAP